MSLVPICTKHHRPMMRVRDRFICTIDGCDVVCWLGQTSTPADRVTRQLRSRAHQVFDPLWKKGRMARAECYERLAAFMRIGLDQCHIGMFDANQCRQVLEFVDSELSEVKGMSLLQKITKGRQRRPRRTVLYGVHGIGKSTWASMWPSPVFIPTEDGIADLDVASFPLCETLTDAWGAIMELSSGEAEHDFKTVVLDSADWLEQLIWKQICEKAGKTAISDFDFGKGYGEAATIFRKVLGALDTVRDAGMHVVVLAHARATKVEPPGEQSYTRYEPKLHKPTTNGPSTSEVLQEWADEVLFTNYKIDVRSEDQGFNRERGIAVGKGERVIYTQEGPAHLAKNRLRLPPELPLDFRAYRQYLEPGKSESEPASEVTAAVA